MFGSSRPSLHSKAIVVRSGPMTRDRIGIGIWIWIGIGIRIRIGIGIV